MTRETEIREKTGKCSACEGVSCRDASCPRYVRFVQVKNPRTGNYVKIDRAEGRVLGAKAGGRPYEGVVVVERMNRRHG